VAAREEEAEVAARDEEGWEDWEVGLWWEMG